MNKGVLTLFLILSVATSGVAQTFEHIATTDAQRWATKGKLKVANSPSGEVVKVNTATPIVTFDKWGTTFNEQDWKALSMLSREEQNEILHNAVSPDGYLNVNMGRISMKTNDYAV